MRLGEAVLRCLSKYAAFSGRARPSEFWWFMLVFALVQGLAVLALLAAPELAPVLLLAVAGLIVPALAVTVRRLHDIGSAGWTLVLLVPVIGQLALLVWLTRPSVRRLNRFGPEPAKRHERLLLFAR